MAFWALALGVEGGSVADNLEGRSVANNLVLTEIKIHQSVGGVEEEGMGMNPV